VKLESCIELQRRSKVSSKWSKKEENSLKENFLFQSSFSRFKDGGEE
jgi:hypothetical protein